MLKQLLNRFITAQGNLFRSGDKKALKHKQRVQSNKPICKLTHSFSGQRPRAISKSTVIFANFLISKWDHHAPSEFFRFQYKGRYALTFHRVLSPDNHQLYAYVLL